MKVSTQEQSLVRPAKKARIIKPRLAREPLFPSTMSTILEEKRARGAAQSSLPQGDGLRTGASAGNLISGLWTLLKRIVPNTETPSPLGDELDEGSDAISIPASPEFLQPARSPPHTPLLRSIPSTSSSPFELAIGDHPNEDFQAFLRTLSQHSPCSNTSSPFEIVIGEKPNENHITCLSTPTRQSPQSPSSTTSSPFDLVIGDRLNESYCASLSTPTRRIPQSPCSDTSSPFDSVIGDHPAEALTTSLQYKIAPAPKMPAFDSPPPQATMPMPSKATPEILRRARFFRRHYGEKDAKRAAMAFPTPPASRLSSFSTSYRPSMPRQRPAPTTESKDDQIDSLINKARHIAIESPRQRRERDAQAKAERLAEEQAIRAKREADELAAIAQLKAEETEAQRKRDEEETARLAAEQKAARKHELIYSVPEDLAHTLESRLSSTSNVNTLLNSVGSFDMKKISYQRILADEAGTNSWLDDETVNAWFHSLVQAIWRDRSYTKSPKAVPPVVAYNSGWWKTQRDKGLKNIAGWSRRQGIKGEKLLECERIFLPINTGAHWTLLIISGTERSIEFLDSMGGEGFKERAVAREWLEMELGDKYLPGEWTDMKRATHRSQIQANVSDCGMFTCFNGLAAAKGVGYKEVRPERMREARVMMAGVLFHGGFSEEFEL